LELIGRNNVLQSLEKYSEMNMSVGKKIVYKFN